MDEKISELERRAGIGTKVGAAVGIVAAGVQTFGYGPIAEFVYDKMDVTPNSIGVYDAMAMSYFGTVLAVVCVVGGAVAGAALATFIPAALQGRKGVEKLIDEYHDLQR